jgi:mycothiol system anti-sigma-R factor
MNCEQTRSLLGAHLDGELDAVNDRELQAHLRECSVCLGEAGQHETLRRMVRQGAPYHRAPGGLEARIRGSLRTTAAPAREITPRPAARSNWLWQWTGAAATVAAVVVAVWIGSAITARRATARYLAEDLVSAHVRSLLASHLTDVPSSDQHTVKPWFAGKVDFAPPVRDLSAEGFPLVGGRLDYVWGQTVAALVFQRNKHFINLFIWPPEAGAMSPEPFVTHRGYNLVSWKQNELTFCAVSDLNRQELEQFAERYRGK